MTIRNFNDILTNKLGITTSANIRGTLDVLGVTTLDSTQTPL